MSSSLWYYLIPWRPVLRMLGVGPSGDGDYEQVLQSLTEKIEHVQSRLAQVRQRERRARVTIPLFAMSLWLVYTCAVLILGRLDTQDLGEAVLWPLLLVLVQGVSVGGSATYWLPTLLIPLAVACSRRPVQWWYGRVHAAEEKHLAALVRKRRGKIDEIKRVTRYDHLRLLLDRYDDTRPPKQNLKAKSSAPGTAHQPQGVPDPAAAAAQKRSGGRQSMPAAMGTMPTANDSLAPPVPALPSQFQKGPRPSSSNQSLRSGRSVSTPWGPGAPAATPPVAASATLPSAPGLGGTDDQTPGPLHGQLSQSYSAGMQASSTMPSHSARPFQPAVPPPPPQRTLMDKLADAILGPDPTLRAPGPEQRYALICRECHHHNGLAWKEDWEEIQYICPHCGTRNSNRPSTVPVTWPSVPLTPRKSLRKLPPSPSVRSVALDPSQEPDSGDKTDASDAYEAGRKPSSPPTPRVVTTPGSDKATTSPDPQLESDPESASTAQAAAVWDTPTATSSSLQDPVQSVRRRTPAASAPQADESAPPPAVAVA